MSLTHSIDIYCERVGPAFWAEPVNAITNAAFLLAAWYGWRLAKREGVADWAIAVLAGLTAAIGVGSFLFHTFAERWAGIADVTPIGLFILAYAFFSIPRFFGASLLTTAVIVAAFIGGNILLANNWPDAPAWRLPYWNGSLTYAPALAAILMLAAALAITGRKAWRLVLAAGATLSASLFFRTIDPAVCAEFPLGTHFLWHILNGLVFVFVLRAIVLYGGQGRRAGA